MPMRKSRFTEEKIAHALRPGRGRHAGRRSVPGDGGERAGLLSLEEAVRRIGGSTSYVGSNCSRKRTAGSSSWWRILISTR
jgi:hypothetical protein